MSSFLLISACEEPEKKKQVVEEELANTLETTDLGGKTGHINDYFYSFNTNIDVEFYRFSSSYFSFNYNFPTFIYANFIFT